MAKKTALQRLTENSAYSKSAGEKLDWTYFDTYKLNTGGQQYTFFAVPLGQGNPAKQAPDTNWELAAQLPQAQNFVIYAIKPIFITNASVNTAALQDIYNFFFNTVIDVRITGKDSMGSWTLAELFGVSTMISLTPTVAGDNNPLNTPNYNGIFPLNLPLKVGATQTLKLDLYQKIATPASLDDCELKMLLQGKLIRLA